MFLFLRHSEGNQETVEGTLTHLKLMGQEHYLSDKADIENYLSTKMNLENLYI